MTGMTAEGRAQRERIQRTAMELFAAQGFRGTSLDAVAAAVGMSRPGLLHYFPSKVDLLLGVLDLRDEDDAARVTELYGESRDLVEALLAIMRRHQEAPELPRLFTVLAAETVDPGHPGHDRFRERYRTARARMTRAVEEAQRADRLSDTIAPTPLATLLLAVMDGLQLQFLLDPDSIDMVEPFAALLAALGGHAIPQKGQNTGTSRIATTPNSASSGRPSFQ